MSAVTTSRKDRIRVGPGEFALVDPAKWDALMQGPAWSVFTRNGRREVARNLPLEGGRRRQQRLVEIVLAVPPRTKVLYLNGDPLDCRAENLHARFGHIRRTMYGPKPYEVAISIRGRQYSGGYWPTREFAAYALAQLGDVRREAVEGAWDRRRVREEVDRAICRIRSRKRRPRATADAAYQGGESEAED